MAFEPDAASQYGENALPALDACVDQISTPVQLVDYCWREYFNERKNGGAQCPAPFLYGDGRPSRGDGRDTERCTCRESYDATACGKCRDSQEAEHAATDCSLSVDRGLPDDLAPLVAELGSG
jgi:hypothetical protein